MNAVASGLVALPYSDVDATGRLIYRYFDEEALLAYEVCRRDFGNGEKEIRLRRPDGAGGFQWGLDGAERLLYRLPDIVVAAENGGIVWYVEGEKCADAMAHSGFASTTLGSASMRPTDRHVGHFEGLERLYVIPDEDEAGRAHATAVATAASSVVQDVRVVRLPGIEDIRGGDVVDWLSLGHDPRTLWHLAERCLPLQGPRVLEEPSDRAASAGTTDLGNAERLVEAHGDDIRYCHPQNSWYVWSGQRWARDQTGEIARMTIDTVRGIYGEAALAEEPSVRRDLGAWARRSEAAPRLDAMEKVARSYVPVLPAEFDGDGMLLNVENGTVDLKTGRMRPHRRDDLITRLAPVRFDADARCSRWEAFLDQVFDSDHEVVGFLKRFIGYCLTGSGVERKLALFHGGGANGKSTLVSVVEQMLGDYAARCPAETLLQKRPGAVSNDVARLRGVRFAAAMETGTDRRVDEATVKALTGNETIQARFLYQEFFEFQPTFKLVLSTNSLPLVADPTDSTWDRVALVPFRVRIPEAQRDRHLLPTLVEELPGILNWSIRGCLEWQQGGLKEPETVRRATSAYRQDCDPVASFLAARCDDGGRVANVDLWQAWQEWCEQEEVLSGSQKALTRAVKARGYVPHRGKDRGFVGLHLLR